MSAPAAGPPLDGLLRWPLAGAALAVLALAVVARTGLAPFGVEPLTAWLMVMAAVACAFAAAGAGTAWRAGGLVAAATWLGVAAQLALTQPLWYQFIRLQPDTAFRAGLWGLVAVQALVAAAAILLGGGFGAVSRRLAGLGPLKTALALFLLFALSSGGGRLFVDHAWPPLAKQFAASGLLVGINLASLAAFAAVLPREDLARLAARAGASLSLPGQADAVRALDRALPWMAAAFALAASLAVALIAFGGAPHLGDEIAYLFQARTLAHGAISSPAPPAALQAGLAYDFLVVREGRWFSIFPPGWPAVLAPGAALGVPWLVNPLLAGAAVLLAHSVVLRLLGRGTANLAAVLLAASPWFLGLSGSLMSHTVTVVLALAAVRLLLAARDGKTWAALLAGAAMGLVFLTRPVDGLVAGVAAGLWTLGFLPRPRGWLAVLAYGAGCLAVGALIFPYNAVLVGDPLRPAIDLYFDQLWGPGSNRLGFGADIGPPNLWGGVDLYRGHSPFEAALSSQLNLYAMGYELMGWPALSLAPALAWLAWGRRGKLELALAAFLGTLVVALGLYWYQDSFYVGPRYWFLALMPLMVLSALGLQALAARLSASGADQAGARLGSALVLALAFAVFAFLPWRGITRYHDHRGFHPEWRAVARSLPGGLIFVTARDENDLASAFALNSPFLEPSRPVFLRDLGPAANAAAVTALPGRPVFHARGRGEDGAAPGLILQPSAR